MRSTLAALLSLIGIGTAACTSSAADADKKQGSLQVEDNGTGNTHRIRQEKDAGKIALKQSGQGQSVDLEQSGGKDNWMDIEQSGSNNRAHVSQSGSGNSVTIRQSSE